MFLPVDTGGSAAFLKDVDIGSRWKFIPGDAHDPYNVDDYGRLEVTLVARDGDRIEFTGTDDDKMKQCCHFTEVPNKAGRYATTVSALSGRPFWRPVLVDDAPKLS